MPDNNPEDRLEVVTAAIQGCREKIQGIREEVITLLLIKRELERQIKYKEVLKV